ncbi:MAG: hypothetical protein GX442_08490 [Candidatus Riflebacteria bacterium]|nr:hypothetical protein [Candidatus Riflebacteria bacterium]
MSPGHFQPAPLADVKQARKGILERTATELSLPDLLAEDQRLLQQRRRSPRP